MEMNNMVKRKTKSQNTLNAIVDGNWVNFNERFRHVEFSEEELKYMLDREMKGSRRRQIVATLHSRYSTVRSMNERLELFAQCRGMPI